MIVKADNRFLQSTAPHSLGLQNAMTIPAPGFDTNPLLINQKRNWGAGQQLAYINTAGTATFPGDSPRFGGLGIVHPSPRPRRWWNQRPHSEAGEYQHWGMGGLGCSQGISGLTMDGSGLFGTGIFSNDLTTWSGWEYGLIAVGAYMLYSSFRQTKVYHTEALGFAHRRRKTRAGKLRERAKALESKEYGSWRIF